MSTENNFNLKKELNKIKLFNAKIFYMINYFFINNHFDKEQKKKLKELVILENSDIIKSFKKFEKNSNLNDLEKDFQKIYENEIGFNIKKDRLKTILEKAWDSIQKNNQNFEISDDEDEEKKQKKKIKKTFIINALSKMKHNDSDSDDEGDY